MAGIAGGLLLAALVMQFAFGLEPCTLCVYQRWPYLAAVVFGLIGARGTSPRWMLVLCAVSFATTGGIAAYHSGVEQGWFTLAASCGGVSEANSIEELRAQLLANTGPACDVVTFAVLGLSLSSWNALVAGALTLLSLFAALSLRPVVSSAARAKARLRG